MAATYLTIGSRFQPFSYAELIAPIEAYQNEYNRQEELYNNYVDTTGLIGSQLSPEYDKDIIDNVYTPYMNDIKSAAEALSTTGLTPGGRRTLQNLRRRFSNEITPIKMAAEARAAARKNWDELSAKDRTLMTNANPYYLGVSSYMNGMSPETTYVSGNELYQRGMNLSQAFSRTMRDVPEEERLAFLNQYWRISNQYGATSQEMQQFMSGMIDAIPALADQIDDILSTSGIYNEGFTEADVARARNYLIEGMKAGLSGETKTQYLQNQAWELTAGGTRTSPEEEVYTPLPAILPKGPVLDTRGRINRKEAREASAAELYIPAEYEGKTYMVPEYLFASIYADQRPEVASEYNHKRDDYFNQVAEELGLYDATGDTQKSILTEVEKIVDKDYPELIKGHRLKKRMEDVIKDNEDILARYGHINPDITQIYKVGKKWDSQLTSHNAFDIAKMIDPNLVSKLEGAILDNKGILYEYDNINNRVGKRVSDKERAKVSDSSKMSGTNRDEYARTKFDYDGKSYYWAGTDVEQRNQAFGEAMNRSFRSYAAKSETIQTPTGEIVMPGIGTAEERPDMTQKYVEEYLNQKGRFSNYIKSGQAQPVTFNGNVLFYRMGINDTDDGYAKVVTILPNGTAVDVADPQQYQGTTNQSRILRIIMSNLDEDLYEKIVSVPKNQR